jgi:peroxiredoxin Q/BCP|tara:strand:+ start:164 stop:628 length:465 start_codon:yes stop_codon:yes gene_type:complete
MILNEGDKAPDFNLQDTEGNKVTLNELLGKKIVIYFYPKDDTPGCTIEACEIRDNYSIFKENNIAVLGVSADTIESHKNFTNKFNLPFPLLADVNKNMCEDYDVLVDKVIHGHTVKGIARITFLIDEEGIIKKIWNPVDPNGHADEILNEISQN